MARYVPALAAARSVAAVTFSLIGPALLAPVALAQAVAPPPPPPAPSVPLPTRQEINPAQPAPAAPPAQAHVDDHAAFARGPCPLAESDVAVAIREVRFTAPGGGALAPQLAALLGGITTASAAQPIKVVCALRDEANARLRAARYIASVQIPAQRIEDGVLRLEVVSGHIVEVRVRGDSGPFENLIRARIEDLKKLDPLNANDAEHLLLLANDVPGLNLQLGLAPSTITGRQGDLVGELKVAYHRMSLMANVQNYNSRILGRETAYLRADFFSLLGASDRTYVAGSSTFDFKKQRILQVGESIGLSGRGDRLAATGTIALSRPDLGTLDLRTRSLIGALEYTRPVWRTVRSGGELAAGFEYAQQRTRVYSSTGSAPLNRDRIATIYARIAADKRKLRFDGSVIYALAAKLELRQGLGILGATRPGQIVDGYAPSHITGSAIATVARGELNAVVGAGPFELANTLRAQWANRQLLNYDQFAIGNLTLGRGYDPGANSGDRAIGGMHELRANLPLRGDTTAQLYGFYDWVRLWNLDPVSTERRRWLISLGGGARLTLLNSLRLDVTYAHPLDPPLLTGVNVHRSPDRVMVSLTAQLIPFGGQR